MDSKGAQEQHSSSLPDIVQVNIHDSVGGKNAAQGELKVDSSTMPDDFTRAGGFGARDDISSFLPVASDFTDVEASLRDARDYEDPQEEICRPGLGWTDVQK